jgi:nucleoside-diphosphate-sugar epimerase
MSDRVLVTGGTGFIGQALVRALIAQGRAVRVLARPASQTHRPGCAFGEGEVEVVRGDMLDPSSLRRALLGVRQVFHLAGRLLIPDVPAQTYEQLHVLGVQNLLVACVEVGTCERVVHCSTTGVLGPTGPTPADETAPLNPGNIYERTKAQGEQLALDLARPHNLALCIARPALVYGPGDLHLLGWFRAIQHGYYAVVGSGDNCLHPIYIDDLITGLLLCAESPAAVGRIYHLVGDCALPIRELARAIARALGRRFPRWHIPLFAAKAMAYCLEALPGISPARLPLTRQRIRFMTESRAYSGQRARDELDFAPQTDLDTGLRQTVAWYRREGLL